MDESQRKARLVILLERMDRDEDVANRDLKNVLSDAQFEQMQAEWSSQKEMRAAAKAKPPEIVEYEKRFKKAAFEYSKAKGYSGSTKRKIAVGADGKKTHKRAYLRSETQFERLTEYLEERIDADPGLAMWFDRELVFGFDGTLGLTPDSMPLVVTTRSLDRVGDGWLCGMQTKRQIKQMALRGALAEIEEAEQMTKRVAERIAEEDAAARAAKVGALLKLTKSRRVL